jgi:hypothetical protein
MITVELFSGKSCSLCEEAKGVIERIQETLSFEFKETILQPGHPYYADYRDRIPVVHLNGVFFGRGKIDEALLRRQLLSIPQDKKSNE